MTKPIEKFYNTYVRYEKWRECARCGFDFPYSALSTDPISGLVVCEGCKDDKGHPEYMADLNLPDEGRDETPGD